jgi:hypothetical protein
MLEAAMAKLYVSQCFVQSSLDADPDLRRLRLHDRAAGGTGLDATPSAAACTRAHRRSNATSSPGRWGSSAARGELV